MSFPVARVRSKGKSGEKSEASDSCRSISPESVFTPTTTAVFATGRATPAPKHRYTFCTSDDQEDLFDEIKDLEPIPQLLEPTVVSSYEVVPVEESLYKLIDDHDIVIVAGSFFGDEGKGKTVDAVAKHPNCTCIARVNSGENAGHTVIDKNGNRLVFNLAPSGLLSNDKRNFIGPECVMDPISFMEKEMSQLVKASIPYHDRLFIGNVYIVTPYHKLLDLLTSAPNSSTLMGMSPVHASKVTKRAIRLDHLFNDDEVLRDRFNHDLRTYFSLLKLTGLSDADVLERCMEANNDGVQRVPRHVLDFVCAKDKVSYLVKLYNDGVVNNPNFPPRCDVIHELRVALERGEKLLLEGPQSYWLSNAREKFWSSTTSADTSAAGLLAASQMNSQRFRTVVINVHKTPASSRVGIGACPSSYVPQDYFSSQDIRTLKDLPEGCCVDFDAIQKKFFLEAFTGEGRKHNGLAEPIEYIDATGTYNIGVAMAISSAIHHGEAGAVTKKPRVCGFFDCVLHHEVNGSQGPYLTISALDRGDDYDKVGLTIAYLYYNPDNKSFDINGYVYRNGDIIHAGSPVPGEVALHHCIPIVKLVDGWKSTPIAASKRKAGEPLPHNVCVFLSAVEHFTKCKVISIGNGPNGDDVIYFRI